MIRFVIEIDEQLHRRVFCGQGGFSLPAEPLPTRHTKRLNGEDFSDGQCWCRDQLNELTEVAKSFTEDSYDPNSEPLLAEYLFQGLLGSDAWDAIVAHADANAPDSHIELAIRVAETMAPDQPELSLHALPWELISRECVAGDRLVTVTRLIPAADDVVPRPLSWPPKILFALGASLADEDLQPAREAMGMLSHFEFPDQGDLKQWARPDVHARVLEKATLRRLEAEIAEFEPEVVYFVCHGEPGHLLLPKHSSSRPREKKDEASAARLLECLNKASVPPSCIVLAACASAETPEEAAVTAVRGPETTGSLAAELVAGGVPIVIGMAGRVTNSGCRLFTRALGHALYNQPEKTLTNHVCYARAAARDAQLDHQPPEWSLPTTFMADNEPTAKYQPFDIEDIERRDRWRQRIKDMHFHDAPIFCCRENLAATYHRMMSKTATCSTLFLVGDEEHGKTRALKEIAIWALRDGHVPFPMIPSSKAPDSPTSARELGVSLLNAIDLVANALLDLPAYPGELLQLLAPGDARSVLQAAADDNAKRNLFAQLRQAAADSPESIDHLSVRRTFGQDALTLRDQLAAKFPKDFTKDSRCLLLLDDGHRYLRELERALIPTNGTAAANGFVDGANERLPVFVTWSERERDSLAEIDEFIWASVTDLPAFPAGIQSQLAYERILLHPFHPKISRKPLCFVSPTNTQVGQWRKLLHKKVKGIPGRLRPNLKFATAVEDMVDLELLVEADDASRLAALRERFGDL